MGGGTRVSGGQYEERYAHGHGRRHAQASGDLSSGLVSYWKLDEATGADRADEVGGNTLADPVGEDVAQAPGKIVSAAGFSGSATNILLGALPSGLPTGALTVSCWIWTEDIVAGALLVRHGTLAAALAWQLLITGSAVRFRVSSDGLVFSTTVSGGAISDLTFAHVAAWHDPDADVIGISVDGAAPTTAAHAGGLSGLAVALDLGGNNGGTAFRVDELGIWSRVLSAAERAQLYNSGAGLAYPFA